MSATAMAETRTASTASTAGARVGALAGLAFAFLFFMGTAMLDLPHGVSDEKMVAWWQDSGHQVSAVVSMYLFVLAGLCFLVFLAKLRSRLLAAEGGTGELTSLVVAGGVVFVAMLFVAAAARGGIGLAIKSPGDDELLPAADTLRYFPDDRVCRARHRRSSRRRGRDGGDIVADRAHRGLRPLARVGRRRCGSARRRRERRSRGRTRDSRDARLGARDERGNVARSAERSLAASLVRRAGMSRAHLPRMSGLLAFCAALMLTAGAPSANAGADRATGGCGNKLVFLVWPHGHPAIPRIAEFPELRNPHIELYLGFNSGYDVTSAGAYAVGGKPPAGINRGGSLGDCLDVGDAVTRGNVPTPHVIIKKETAVMCTLPGAPVTDVVFRKGGVTDLYLHSGPRLLAHAHVTKSSAVLTVPAGRCRLAAPPRP